MSRTMQPFMKQGKLVKTKLVTICLMIGTALASLGRADEDSDTGLPQPMIFVKDSVITAVVKAKLAIAYTAAAVVTIHVDG